MKICTEPAPPPSDFDPDLADFDRFFQKAFSRNPDERFQTARELALELATAAGVPPTSTRLGAHSTWSRSFNRAKVQAALERGSTDIVAIATIVPEEDPGEEAAPLADATVEPREARATIPAGRMRHTSHGGGTLTEAPRTLDVVHRAPVSRPPRLLMWAGATLVALTGLVAGAVVALNVLSWSTETATPRPQAGPPLSGVALPLATSVAALEAAPPALVPAPLAAASPLASSAIDSPRSPPIARPRTPPGAVPSAARSASPAARPPGRRSLPLGI